MKEFKVNDFITLRLEDGLTNIYMNGELFDQCVSVITRKKVSETKDLLEIESVDELAEHSIDNFIDNSDPSFEDIEPDLIEIPAEVRFWVHSSNLQTWYENNYDTRLLHSNLAFPLLKKLTEVGDIQAKKVFKEEIAKRLKYGSYWTQKYLFAENYVSYLSQEELINGVLNPMEANALIEILTLTRQDYRMIPSFDEDEFRHEFVWNFYFSAKDGHVNELELVINPLHAYIPKVVANFKKLITLYVYIGGTDDRIPEFNVKIDSLRILKIFTTETVMLPDAFDSFPNLIKLLIRNETHGLTMFERIPETIGCLKDLSKLEIDNVLLKTLPSSIGNLKMLDWLIIRNAELESLPDSIYDLEYLDRIVFEGNPLKISPKIKSLEVKFKERVYSLIKERTLKGLNTSVNDLKEAFNNVPEYKIHNRLYELKRESKIKEENKEEYLAKI